MKKKLKLTANILLWIFVVFASLTMVLTFSSLSDADGVPSLFGKSLITIRTDSMDPAIKGGDLIIIERASVQEQSSYEVGNVITFKADLDRDGTQELNTHRIIEVITDGKTGVVSYKTKGDNNTLADDYTVDSYVVIGEYIEEKSGRIGGLGSFIEFLRSSTGFLIVIVIPLALFFLYELYSFISLLAASKRKKLSASEEEEIKRRAVEEYLKSQESQQNSPSHLNDNTKDKTENDEPKAEDSALLELGQNPQTDDSSTPGSEGGESGTSEK